MRIAARAARAAAVTRVGARAAAWTLPAFVALACTAGASAQVTWWEGRGLTLRKEVTVPLSPEAAYDAFTGDVSPWWDHTMAEHPKSLVIEPRAGGAFRETFDDDGNGVIHADVIYADRGKVLRLRGPFGFSGKALDLVHTFTFTAAGSGSTRVSLELNGVGQVDDAGAAAMDRVWDHFLGRYVEWVTAGMPARLGG